MSDTSTYDMLRHMADSWGLVGLGALFLLLAGWPFRPGGAKRNHDAANMIFGDENDGR